MPIEIRRINYSAAWKRAGCNFIASCLSIRRSPLLHSLLLFLSPSLSLSLNGQVIKRGRFAHVLQGTRARRMMTRVLGFRLSRRRFRALVPSIPVVTFQHLITSLVRRGSLTRAPSHNRTWWYPREETRLMSIVIYRRERGVCKKKIVSMWRICSPRLCTVNNGGLSRSTPPFDLCHSSGMRNDRFAWRSYEIRSKRVRDILQQKFRGNFALINFSFLSLSLLALQFDDYIQKTWCVRVGDVCSIYKLLLSIICLVIMFAP